MFKSIDSAVFGIAFLIIVTCSCLLAFGQDCGSPSASRGYAVGRVPVFAGPEDWYQTGRGFTHIERSRVGLFGGTKTKVHHRHHRSKK